jgi:hypothetical protein
MEAKVFLPKLMEGFLTSTPLLQMMKSRRFYLHLGHVDSLINRRFHDRIFIILQIFSSVSDARFAETKLPLSENADSDGTDDPIIMMVSRARRLNVGNRVLPIVLRHKTMSLQELSGFLVTSK